MIWQEALQFAFTEERADELQFHLLPSNCQVTLRTRTSDVRCFEKILLAKEYETPFPTNPQTIVDAGANIGLATLYYAQEYPEAKIISIEPEHSNFQLLKRNCASLPNVTLIEGALWDKETSLAIQDAKAEKWGFSVAESSATPSTESPEIKAVTIPSLLSKFDRPRIDILKLDIEGAEYMLFKNNAESWLGAVEQIVIELHDRYQPGCAQAFYAAIGRRPFVQEIRGECIFIKFLNQEDPK